MKKRYLILLTLLLITLDFTGMYGTVVEPLLKAINEVLADLMVKDADGKTEIEKMVMRHMGMDA